jgi:YHS domain-containing protein
MATIDPVCKQEVQVDENTPKFEGCPSGTFYFCSEDCKIAFENDQGLFYQLCHD